MLGTPGARWLHHVRLTPCDLERCAGIGGGGLREWRFGHLWCGGAAHSVKGSPLIPFASRRLVYRMQRRTYDECASASRPHARTVSAQSLEPELLHDIRAIHRLRARGTGIPWLAQDDCGLCGLGLDGFEHQRILL